MAGNGNLWGDFGGFELVEYSADRGVGASLFAGGLVWKKKEAGKDAGATKQVLFNLCVYLTINIYNCIFF